MTTTSELGEFTTEQLVEELLSRPTFAGFVVCSEEEVKQPKAHQKWCIAASSNLTTRQIKIILKEMTVKLGATT
jgi:hypothetical protein